jgi:tRNA (guanine-N7-)-methyltransferase
MSRKKRLRFEALPQLPNSFDRDDAGPGGAWVGKHFGNTLPLILELGCGKGEYTLALARNNPTFNVIGIDRRGDRLWIAATGALRAGLSNAAFLRADIHDLKLYFDDHQLESIWLPFPDPRPKRRQAKHRLLSPEFLRNYRKLVRPGGRLHVKTDDKFLFEYLQESVGQVGGTIHEINDNLYEAVPETELLGVRTTFEERHLQAGRSIKYVSFSLGGE